LTNTPAGRFVDAILRSFGSVLFTAKRRSGFFFFLAILLSPLHLIAGMVGVSLGILTGHVLAPDSPWQKLGFPGGAGFFAALALVAFLPPHAILFVLLPTTAILAAFLVLALAPSFSVRSLPVLALPFVLAVLVGLGTAELFGLDQHIRLSGNWTFSILASWEATLVRVLPGSVQDFLTTFGSLLFNPGLLSGLLVLTGVLLGSRITAIAMLLGGLIGSFLLARLVPGLAHEELGLIAFNAVLTAAAMTGVFVALTKRGILWSLTAVLTSVFLTAAMHVLFKEVSLPVLALPFCLVVWLFLLPLVSGVISGWRTSIWAPPLAMIGRAEDNLRAFERWRRDMKHAYPTLTLPLHGLWKVTQGAGGLLTHNTSSGHFAWDFMLIDEDERAAAWPGTECDQFHGYGCPVLAPADGVVTAMEGRFPDNPVGSVDTKNPWGNWIMLTHPEGSTSLLAHLRPGSLNVTLGQSVVLGQEIGQVGNSGRSPEPHLHYQLNATPWLAAHSLDASFGSFVVFEEDSPTFYPLGKLKEGQSLCTWRSLDWPSWADYFPLGIPGSKWEYRTADGELCELHLTSGQGGRLILDDGFTRVQVMWWPGWIQLLPLLEGDPDLLSTDDADRGPLYWMLLLSPVLPLKGVHGLQVCQDVYHTRVASVLRRMFTLEGPAELKQSFATSSDSSDLKWSSSLRAESGRLWHAHCTAFPKEGLTSFRVESKGRTLVEFHLSPKASEIG
jgi:urea transporter